MYIGGINNIVLDKLVYELEEERIDFSKFIPKKDNPYDSFNNSENKTYSRPSIFPPIKTKKDNYDSENTKTSRKRKLSFLTNNK